MFLKYITSEFIKELNMYGLNSASKDDDQDKEAITKFVTTYDKTYNQNQSTMSARKKAHTNCLGLAGMIYFKYIPSLIRNRFNSKPEILLDHFPKNIKRRTLEENVEMEPVFVLALGRQNS